jgi:hypothetical protein
MRSVFRTNKLPQAAFLEAKGIRLLRCELTGPGRCEFLYTDPNGEVERLASAYYNGGICEAMAFYRAILDLKSAINQTTGRTFPATGGAR